MIKYKVKNGDVHLQVYASKSEKDTTLLFVHNCTGDGAWPLIMQHAIQTVTKNHRCVFFDQRGSGLSFYDLKQGIPFDEIMNDLHAIAEDIHQRFGEQKIILCAESIGAFVALLATRTYPEYFHGLILFSPLILLTNEYAQKFFEMVKHNCLEHGHLELKKMINLLDDKTPEEFFMNQHIHQWIYSTKNPSLPLRYVAAMSSWLFTNPTEDILHNITIPTLIMQGSDDMIAKEGNVVDTLVRLKNPFIVYEAFPYSGHFIYEDQNIDFIERIERFLKDEFPCDTY